MASILRQRQGKPCARSDHSPNSISIDNTLTGLIKFNALHRTIALWAVWCRAHRIFATSKQREIDASSERRFLFSNDVHCNKFDRCGHNSYPRPIFYSYYRFDQIPICPTELSAPWEGYCWSYMCPCDPKSSLLLWDVPGSTHGRVSPSSHLLVL